jgi:large subunit ribosomal protein L9
VIAVEVILLEKVSGKGGLGSRVSVKAGFARNYLIPYGKAVFATKQNIEAFESRRADLEKAEAEKLAQCKVAAEKIAQLSVTISARSADEGKLFGSVGLKDIADAMLAQGATVQKSQISMPTGPIRQVGEYEFEVRLHADVVSKIKVVVVPL